MCVRCVTYRLALIYLLSPDKYGWEAPLSAPRLVLIVVFLKTRPSIQFWIQRNIY